jgi:hypothetical protein
MKRNKIIYICLFILLYFCVGFVSTIHAVSFFSLANTAGLAVMLAIAFEIGQAAVLFDILTNPSDRKKFMPWALMCCLTFVQILGNVFSSYKYLITNSVDNLKYFKDPIFVWTTIPDDMANVILTYLIGGILPIVSLALSEMVTSRLSKDEDKEDSIKDKQPKEDKQSDESIQQSEIEDTNNIDIEYSNTADVLDNVPVDQSKQNSHFINL